MFHFLTDIEANSCLMLGTVTLAISAAHKVISTLSDLLRIVFSLPRLPEAHVSAVPFLSFSIKSRSTPNLFICALATCLSRSYWKEIFSHISANFGNLYEKRLIL